MSLSAEQVNQQAVDVATSTLNDTVVAAAQLEQVTQDQQLKAFGVGGATRGMAKFGKKLGGAMMPSVGNMSKGLETGFLPKTFILAVTATTLSIIAVFIPVAFMGGGAGEWFRPFALTVAASVLVSLFISFTLDPMLSAYWGDPVGYQHQEKKGIRKWLGKFNAWFDHQADRYGHVIAWALHHRIWMTVIAVVTFVRLERSRTARASGAPGGPGGGDVPWRRTLGFEAAPGDGRDLMYEVEALQIFLQSPRLQAIAAGADPLNDPLGPAERKRLVAGLRASPLASHALRPWPR